MRDCIDEGILQGYLDGELSPETVETVTDHLAVCDLCAGALREAENETAIFAAATTPEMSLSVPTERLRERLKATIAQCDAPNISPTTNSESSVRAWFTLFKFPSWRPAFSFAVALILIGVAIGGVKYLYSQRNASVGKDISSTGMNSTVPGAGGADKIKTTDTAVSKNSSGPNEAIPTSDRENIDGPIPARLENAGGVKNVDRITKSTSVARRHERNEDRLTPSEKEAVKARLMLALHIAGAKLNYTQKKVIQNIYRQPDS